MVQINDLINLITLRVYQDMTHRDFTIIEFKMYGSVNGLESSQKE